MKIDTEKIKQISKKHEPEILTGIGWIMVGTMNMFRDEYQEEMRLKHPDWFKTES